MYKLIDIRTGRTVATFETHAKAWAALKPWLALVY